MICLSKGKLSLQLFRVTRFGYLTDRFSKLARDFRRFHSLLTVSLATMLR